MLRVGDPGPHALLDFDLGHGPVPPAVPQAAQPISEATYVLLREAPAAAGEQARRQNLDADTHNERSRVSPNWEALFVLVPIGEEASYD